MTRKADVAAGGGRIHGSPFWRPRRWQGWQILAFTKAFHHHPCRRRRMDVVLRSRQAGRCAVRDRIRAGTHPVMTGRE